MTRIEHIGDTTLYLGNCLDILPTLGLVDAVVTDPPYGLNFRKQKWDRKIPDWLNAARRVARAVIFTTAPTTLWDYPRADQVANWYRPASSCRNVSGGFNHWSPVLIYGDVKVPVDTINLHAYPQGFEHPCPKPEALMEWLVSFVNGTILDPFMGSGTTGVVCMKLGRKFIGIEIEPKYFDIACRRLDKFHRQATLCDFDTGRPMSLF